MKPSTAKAKLQDELRSSQNQRDARIEDLWRTLDPEKKGELDFTGLQQGLCRVDHPMKNADAMLRKILEAVDTNGDGRIQFEEFRTFVQKAEEHLYLLFKSIDRDNSGKLMKDDLRIAFTEAGLSIPSHRLAAFFKDVDINNDGYISFDEWRDFLLFMPDHSSGAPLEAVLSFYSTIVTLNAEGDSLVNDDILEGLGTAGSLLQNLFGSIIRIASPSGSASPRTTSPESPAGNATHVIAAEESVPVPMRDPREEDTPSTSTAGRSHLAAGKIDERSNHDRMVSNTSAVAGAGTRTETGQKTRRNNKLTDFVPDPGYFLAGAIAGGVSRTATAPLDRLKVYLLVNTKPGSGNTMAALRQGRLFLALQGATTPFKDAVKDLWRSGGFRTFFTGNGLNVIKIMPETAIKFGSYEAAKRTLANIEGHGDPKKINPLSKFTAGGVAGMISQACVYPLDTLKFRLQCETVQGGLKGNALVMATAKKMMQDGGIRTAYRGLTMGLVGMFPYSAIDMATFEFLKTASKRYIAKRLDKHEDDIVLGNILTGCIGATSGAFGASVVYPLNVLRTRLQTQGTIMHKATYTGIWDVAVKTVRGEGVRGLYKGLTPNLLKVAPALSITWVVYENSKRFLGLV